MIIALLALILLVLILMGGSKLALRLLVALIVIGGSIAGVLWLFAPAT